MRLRRGPLLGAALVVVLGSSSASSAQPTVNDLVRRLDLVAYAPGTRPPPFDGPTLQAQALSLADLGGKVVLVNFWATWCLDCRPEMPVLQKLHREFGARGLAVVGVNVREHQRDVGRYATELAITFPLVLDPAGRNTRRYGVVGVPTTFVVARDGRAVAFVVGPRDWGSAAARELIETLLAEPPPSP